MERAMVWTWAPPRSCFTESMVELPPRHAVHREEPVGEILQPKRGAARYGVVTRRFELGSDLH